MIIRFNYYYESQIDKTLFFFWNLMQLRKFGLKTKRIIGLSKERHLLTTSMLKIIDNFYPQSLTKKKIHLACYRGYIKLKSFLIFSYFHSRYPLYIILNSCSQMFILCRLFTNGCTTHFDWKRMRLHWHYTTRATTRARLLPHFVTIRQGFVRNSLHQ